MVIINDLPRIPSPVTSFIPTPLSVADDSTLEAWCNAPEWDDRTLEEFARDGGRPVGPPNRSVKY